MSRFRPSLGDTEGIRHIQTTEFGFSLPDFSAGNPKPSCGRGRPSVVVLYILVVLSFVVWVPLLALAMVKREWPQQVGEHRDW